MSEPTALSTTLYGDEGSLSWQVRASGADVSIVGRSPSWKVTHTATADLAPILTDRADDQHRRTQIRWHDTGATVTLGERTTELDEAGLWDTDVLDVRLGFEVQRGARRFAFRGIDPKNGTVFAFTGEVVGTEPVDGVACHHLVLRAAGVLGWVSPTWHYWYDEHGRLRQFDGPAGRFGPEPA